MVQGIPPLHSSKKKKQLSGMPKVGSFTLSDYIHSLGINTNNVFWMDLSKSTPDILVREVKRILNKPKES